MVDKKFNIKGTPDETSESVKRYGPCIQARWELKFKQPERLKKYCQKIDFNQGKKPERLQDDDIFSCLTKKNQDLINL